MGSATSAPAPGRGISRPTADEPAAGPAVRALRLLALLGLLAYGAHSLAGFGGAGSDKLFEDWDFNALFLAGAALCLLRARASRTDRWAWVAMGVGLACWAAGEILFVLDPGELSGGAFPSTSDYLWLAFYPAAFVTMGLLVRARVRQFFPSLWLDGLVGALIIAALVCQFVLPPILAATGGSTSEVVGDLIYPFGDLLLLGFVICVLALTGWRPGRVLAMVAVGLVAGAVADSMSLYSSASGGNGSTVFESLWPASAVALGLAAWQPALPSSVIGLHGRRLLVLPLSFAAAALALLALRDSEPLHGAAYVLAIATLAAAITRMGLTFSENLELVKRSRGEALTDALTGLGNRRRLLSDLEDAVQSASEGNPWGLLMLDLDGFKSYNDNFGHPLGDALLARLGARLQRAAETFDGRAYRLGGDEFCVLTRLERAPLESVFAAAVAALTESGRGFEISTSCGAITLAEETRDISQTLKLADTRLYADKRSRRPNPESDQLRAVLLAVIAESKSDLPEHLREVAELAQFVGRRMGLQGEDLETVVRAAELHDVGKVAIPEAILNKPAALDSFERAIVERHCEVGERILSAAPAMDPVARLVRASHERYDGRGYPDRTRGEEIPLGARIIAVCDAFHAMTTERPYSGPMARAEAIAELRRESGRQFDPAVVEAFCLAFEANYEGPAAERISGMAHA